MSLKYTPDPDAVLDEHWSTVFLSMRDAAAQIPINFITRPGAHIAQACFPDGVYDDLPAQRCISNLLATHFSRLVVDLYWDSINRQFNLCPVELPPLAGNATSGYSVDVSALSSLTATDSATVAAPPLSARDYPTAPAVVLTGRQASTANTTATPTSTSTPTRASPTTGTTTSTMAPIPTTTGATGETLLELGPYKCSLDLNLDSIISLFTDYFAATEDTLSARLHFLDINLHAAAPFTAPADPAHTPAAARLPSSTALVGAQIQSQLPVQVFTPALLQGDRRHLNESWYRNTWGLNTDTSYFVTSAASNGIAETQDGWPGEEWFLFTDNRRLLLSWLHVDPQMQSYDFATDATNVFAAGYIDSPQPVDFATDGSGALASGCFYRPGETAIQQTNASWALTTINQTADLAALSTSVTNLTACGISSMLNFTLGNSSMLTHLNGYQDFARATVYGWAPTEPYNYSAANPNNSAVAETWSCAVIDASPRYQGRWRVDQCLNKHRVACRINASPYAWQLSSTAVSFLSAPSACPEHTTFDLPRTGLENTYLYHVMLNDSGSAGSGNVDDDGGASAEPLLPGVWINFNSLDMPDCWVTGGPNATCPYSGDGEEELHQRQVLIPAIAALIVLILTVLTLLVKCNENRRNSRTRRRGDKGWEYEGVPS